VYLLSCVVLILFVLLQPGKSDAAAVFGGGANSTAFGPRGTTTVMARVTVGAAILFFLIAFLFSIPGLIGKKPLGKSVGGAGQSAPAPITPVPSDQAIPTGPPEVPAAAPPAGDATKPAAPTGSPAPAKSPGK
jgi:preprotein translocase subunit SecG